MEPPTNEPQKRGARSRARNHTSLQQGAFVAQPSQVNAISEALPACGMREGDGSPPPLHTLGKPAFQRPTGQNIEAPLSGAPNKAQTPGGFDTSKLLDQLAMLVASWRAIAGAITAITAIVVITYGLVSYIEIAPLERENKRLISDLESAQNQKSALQSQIERVEASARHLAAVSEAPVPVKPTPGASLISNQVRFTWSYAKNHPTQSYLVEVVNMRGGQFTTLFWLVPSLGKEELTIRNLDILVGRNFWRVRPGTLAERGLADDTWSRYSDFSFYRSPGERIMQTKKLRIGTHTMSHATPFNCRDAAGNQAGFDIELIQWVSERLGLQPELVDLDWNDLLLAVKRNDVDVACGSLTASKGREDNFGVRFSVGYLDAHPALLSAKPKPDFPSGLKGATVAVAFGTTNRDAALYLARQFDFKVKEYKSYSNMYDDLDAGNVDFVLFDGVLADLLAGGKYLQYGPLLDEYLSDFYRQELGRDSYQYAFALPAEADKEGYADNINRVLASPEAKAFIENLKRKWLTPHTPCMTTVD